ncbi:MAG: dihydropteroate synthase [Gammaproteobacteria bacterium]|nr:dihydropteroate synthase [Gammaproteobacteria bacterium]MBT8109809.1 dihydropteroate synthase [Gammaproteobacteria bacterium]NNL44511.1 dihydropteroate synthase [Woeseiaceae bacterium]
MLRLGSLNIRAPAVMGILNVTPDSFSDGGRFDNPDVALRQAVKMADAGAAIIDIGGESTRPGAKNVSEQQELDRVLPIIESIRAVTEVPVSVDTSKPDVMRAAVAAGASMINDVYALRAAGAVAAAVELKVPVCLMHMRGQPRTMQDNPQYDDVVAEVAAFLESRIEACVAAGFSEDLIVVDPGFGFGKTHDHNIELLANLRQLRVRDRPMLVGVSRKSTLGELTGRSITERVPASIAAAVVAVMQGADIIRAHDVQETVDALKVVRAIMETGKNL